MSLFHEAVAERSGKTADEVLDVLDKFNVVAAPSTTPSPHLRVSRVAFRGIKSIHGKEEPLDFDWCTEGDGVWGLVSDENDAGKSSVVQVILWALRGTPKSLNKPVINWIRHVEVSFEIGARPMLVTFDAVDGNPSGTVQLGSGAPESFGNDSEFRQLMEGIMLDSLGFEPLAASQRTRDGNVRTYSDGWLAYTNAFLSDANSNALMGETHDNDLLQRILSVFLGVPFASTLFQARSQLAKLTDVEDQRKTKRAALGNASLEDLEVELAGVDQQIADYEDASEAQRQLANAQRAFFQSQHRYIDAEQRHLDLALILVDAEREFARAEGAVLAMKQENVASAVFKRLQPVCCPRCSHDIGQERREREATKQQCSVCSEALEPEDEQKRAALIGEAEARVKTARQAFSEVRKLENVAKETLAETDAARKLAGEALTKIRKLGTDADMEVLEATRERLKVLIEVGRSMASAAGIEADDKLILEKAVDEAKARRDSAAAEVLEAVSAELTRLMQHLGMDTVESIKLDQAVRTRIVKGGQPAWFKDLTPGEQLRLRIATTIALVRCAKRFGLGRHPGLLFVDSPGNQEMYSQNLTDLLKELVLMTEEGGVQLFVAMQGIEKARAGLPEARLLIGHPKMW